MSAPIKLSTGRTEEAYFADGSDMTRAEWGEYCEIVRRRNAVRLARESQQNATLHDFAELADEMGMDDVAEQLREQASC